MPNANGFELRDMSVVNGAQSVIALFDNRDSLASSMRLFVKVIEIGDRRELAHEVAIRSNTQNPVTTRNLRALDPEQLRLATELAARGFTFETRSDSSTTDSQRTIRNDDIAQLVCGVLLERPWLAVKRVALFSSENYSAIFSRDLSAEQVVLLDTLARLIAEGRGSYTEDYRRAWRLTALTAAYLVGQILRASPATTQLLLRPEPGQGDSIETGRILNERVKFVEAWLKTRHDREVEKSGFDDFRVSFKRMSSLKTIGLDATREWVSFERTSR